jgi:hypothetical protein
VRNSNKKNKSIFKNDNQTRNKSEMSYALSDNRIQESLDYNEIKPLSTEISR